VAGTLDASAPQGGDGGFIETSGRDVRVDDAAVITTRAAQGRTGTWLVDPTDFTVSAGSATQSTSGIGADTLGAALANSSVTLSTDNSSGSGLGDIRLNAPVGWSANTTLTLNAYHDIQVNAAITATGNAAGLVLDHGNHAVSGSVTTGTDYYVRAPVTLSGSSATLSINGSSYTLIRSMTALDGIDSTGLAGRYALAQDLDASGTTYTSALVGASKDFTGSLTGLGHTISKLTINANARAAAGLFGTLSSGATLRDIRLQGLSLTNTQGSATGGLVGALDGGLIVNAHVGGTISGGAQQGGLVGLAASGSISRSSSSANILAAQNSSQTNGGLVGYSAVNISSSHATGDVSTFAGLAGGLVGAQGGKQIVDSYATGNVQASSSSSAVGGLAGSVEVGATISRSYALGSVSGSNKLGGLAGANYGSVTSSFWKEGQGATVYASSGSGTVDTLTRSLGSIEFATLSTFTNAGWNADASGGTTSTWRLYEGSTQPLLRTSLVPLLVSIQPTSKTYDGSVAAGTSYALSDASLTLQGSLSFASTSASAGSYSTTDGSLQISSSLHSTQAGYDITYADAGTSILPATLTANTTAANKVYDGSTAASIVGGLSGVVGGDSVVLLQSGSFADKNAGIGKTVSYSSSLTGTDAANYVLAASSGSTMADIKPATLTASATAGSKVYDANIVATINGNLSGIIGSDSVSLKQTGSFADKNVGAGKTVSYTSTLSGTDAANYQLATSTGTTTADITPAQLAITADDALKIQHTTLMPTHYSVSGLLDGDGLAGLTLSSAGSPASAAAGTYAITPGAALGSGLGNYRITYLDGQLSVVPAASDSPGFQAALQVTRSTEGSDGQRKRAGQDLRLRVVDSGLRLPPGLQAD
jgi:hypothetical protein